MQFGHMGSDGRGSVELLSHRPSSHDQVAHLVVGECAERKEEGKWVVLRVRIVLAVLDRVDIHVVET